MAVEIVGDPNGLLNASEFECVVATVPDYVPAVQRIKETVAKRKPLQVLARDRACAVWLERLAASYNDTDVRYSIRTARDLLSERWQMAIPDYVADEAILATGLLEAEIVPRAGQSFEDVVLEHYWGEFFTFVAFPTRLAGEFIDSLEPERWRLNRGHPLALRVLQERQEQWLKRASRRELKRLIRTVFESPDEVKVRLGQYKLLRDYPPHVSQAVMGNWYTLFKNLQIDPTPVSLDNLGLNDTIQEIQYYLNDLSSGVTDQAEFKAVLDEMSGFLLEEFEWVLEQLREGSESLQPTSELLRDIRNRFRPLHDQIEDQLTTLEATIPPACPSDPAKNTSVNEWLDWAVSEYLPYRFWLEENDRWDETVANYAVQYADWFYENYITHKYQYQDRWVSNLLNHAGTSLSAGRKVLFILVDNFNFKYLETLTDQFQRRGFRVTGQMRPVWSLIPTTTEVSKWSLVAGEPELGDVQGNDYDDILQKDWHSHFRDYRVTYLAKLSDLEKRRQFNEDLILLNYLPIDTVLHQDERKIGTTHSSEIRGYIQALVEVVTQFASRTKVQQGLDIYIASDHGSTKIPADVGNEPDNRFYRERAQDRHHRYITVPEKRAINPTSYDQTSCYVVRSDAFGTREDYFIPRGYGRFIQTDESIYVHGGLTPEETIVPFCKLAKTEPEVQQPTIYLPDNVVRYSVKAELVFRVGNPNEHDITNIELNVLESDLPGEFVDRIPAGVAREVTVPVRIKRRPGASDLESVTIQGSFELQGQRYPLEVPLIPVEARSLMESKTEFDFGV